MSPEQRVSAKRHSRITDARLAIKRAERLHQLKPYPSEERLLIRDMRLALVDLLAELEG